jgi:hypothetical protein
MARMRPWIWGVLAAGAAWGVWLSTRDAPPAPADARPLTDAERAELRPQVLAAATPFPGRPAYADADPALVDACIAEADAADRRPTDDRRGHVAEVIRRAAASVRRKLVEPAGLARLTAAVAARYDHPTITREGDAVTVDAGVVRGPLSEFRNAMTVSDSAYVVQGQWATTEAIRFLQLGVARHPDARTVRAEVWIPRRSISPEWRYVYDRGEDRIRVYARDRPDAVYVSAPLGGDAAHARSLATTDLEQQTLGAARADPDARWP